MSDVRLNWGPTALEPGRRQVKSRDFMEEPVDLIFPDNIQEQLAAATEPTEVPLSAAELVIVATSPRLKLSRVLSRQGLDEVPPSIRLTEAVDRPDVFRTPFSGVRILAAVIVAKDLPPEPLRATRSGTWLALAEFEIVTDLGDVGFTPQPLTDEDRENLGLPEGAIHYFELDGVLAPEQADRALTVYVDEELLSELNDQSSQPVAKLLQQELFVDAMRAVVAAVSREWTTSTTPAEIEGSLAHRLAQALAGEKEPGPETEYALQQMRSQPELAGARIETLVPGYGKSRIDALRTGGS